MKYYLGSPAEGIWGWNKYIKVYPIPHTHQKKKVIIITDEYFCGCSEEFSCQSYLSYLWSVMEIDNFYLTGIIKHIHIYIIHSFFVCFNRKHGRNDWWWSVQGECVHIEPSACQTESFTWHILLRQAPSRWQPSWWPLGQFFGKQVQIQPKWIQRYQYLQIGISNSLKKCTVWMLLKIWIE